MTITAGSLRRQLIEASSMLIEASEKIREADAAVKNEPEGANLSESLEDVSVINGKIQDDNVNDRVTSACYGLLDVLDGLLERLGRSPDDRRRRPASGDVKPASCPDTTGCIGAITGAGDQGETFVGQELVSKDSPLLEAIGAVQELQAAMDFAMSMSENKSAREHGRKHRHVLSEVIDAIRDPRLEGCGKVRSFASMADEVTDEVRRLMESSHAWGVSSVHSGAAAWQLAWAVCRRAERAIVRLGLQARRLAADQRPVDFAMLRYMNRLSELFQVYASVLHLRSA